jgi:ABC-type amino acid transport substrate-binding protein
MSKGAIAFLCAMLLGLSAAPPGEPLAKLRVCADPDNLPFSSERGGERGLYVDLAELVASRLGAPAEYFWWRSYFGKRTVRNTLLSDECDAYFGLPYDRSFMSQSVALTRPFLDMGYAVIAPRALGLSAVDALRGRRVAVQFSSSPQLLLSERGGYELVTFREPDEALDALARGEVDAAFVWGPVAGYYNKKKLGGAYQVSPVAGPGLQWQAAVGVRKGQDALRTGIERELDQLGPDIARLADKYGAGDRVRARRRHRRATGPHRRSPRRPEPVQPALLALPRPQRDEPRAEPRPAPPPGALRRQDAGRDPHDREGRAPDQGHADLGRCPQRRRHRTDRDLSRVGPELTASTRRHADRAVATSPATGSVR